MHPITRLFVGYILLSNSLVAMAQDESAQPPLAAAKSQLQARLQAADANDDGYIDRQEAEAKLPRIAKGFDQLDQDDDGKLSAGELKAVAERIGQKLR